MTTTTHLPVWSHMTATLHYPDGSVSHQHISTLDADPNPLIYLHVSKGRSTCGYFKAMRREMTRERTIDKCLGLFRTRAKAMRAMEKRFGLPVCPNKAPGAARR